jgi:hypothetical protein
MKRTELDNEIMICIKLTILSLRIEIEAEFFSLILDLKAKLKITMLLQTCMQICCLTLS